MLSFLSAVMTSSVQQEATLGFEGGGCGVEL